MSPHPSIVTLAAVVTTGLVLVGVILLGPIAAFGAEQADQWETAILAEPTAPQAPILPAVPGVTVLPSTGVNLPVGPYRLDEKDEIAALERIQFALSEVGDGKTYVWRRWHGRLSGLVQPTASFRASDGKVCRHLVVLMTTGQTTKKQEGIACRLPSGRWQLEG
jgi:surface antigen